MNNFQVIAVFTYPTDLAVVKTLLESKGINCFVRDELTVQVHNFYSNAIGGIRLEVPIEEIENARSEMTEAGFGNFLEGGYTDSCEKDNHDASWIKYLRSSINILIVLVVFFLTVIVALIFVYE